MTNFCLARGNWLVSSPCRCKRGVGPRSPLSAYVGTREQRSTSWKYDRDGNPIRYVDACGSREQYAYDDRGNLTDEFDHFGNHVRYEYDKLHRRSKIIDQRGFETTYEYYLVGNQRTDA